MASNPLNKSEYTGRKIPKTFEVRGEYFRDQTAIIHSTPFRRLKKKTQVFFDPINDHICTRIEHVMHVATVAATICKGLNQKGWDLDIDLAYAIGLGHDLGHAPFGHSGEEALDIVMKKQGGFCHEVNGFRTVEYLTNKGNGLNLTYAVKDGITCHNGEHFEQCLSPAQGKNDLEQIHNRNCKPCSYEGCIVRLADKIAYLGRDIEDAYIAHLIAPSDIPSAITKNLGQKNGEIIDTLVEDVIYYSFDKAVVGFSEDKYYLMRDLKDFNYEKIYRHPRLEQYKVMCTNVVNSLFEHFLDLYNQNGFDIEVYLNEHLDVNRTFGGYLGEMKHFYQANNTPAKTIVCDYVAGMTDEYALDCMKQITIPMPLYFPSR